MAKQCSQRCTPEEYAIALAKHYVSTYPMVRIVGLFGRDTDCRHIELYDCARVVQVSKAKIHVDQQPWKRVDVDGTPHQHGDLA